MWMIKRLSLIVIKLRNVLSKWQIQIFSQGSTKGWMLTNSDRVEMYPSLAASRSLSSRRLVSLLSAAAQTKHCFRRRAADPQQWEAIRKYSHHFIPSSIVMISSSSVTSLGIWAVPLIILAQASYRSSNRTISLRVHSKDSLKKNLTTTCHCAKASKQILCGVCDSSSRWH